ncbi:hypothetical protein LEN26_018649 [Aphanomyces euteiches]|nr:hypothetical protein LEN26_018649 [Aphanomyces euteiches]KAH9104865.1 hypothetical protein AeMF1_019208 [Aphanomyces euteiches]KAH9196658.1 hypothetical protein AeNC1_001383 [Aphanomyces euteiches]
MAFPSCNMASTSISQLDELERVAEEAAQMHEETVDAVRAIALATQTLQRDFALVVRDATKAMGRANEALDDHTLNKIRTEAVHEFVTFLSKSVEMHNAQGLAQLALAFLNKKDQTQVDKFVSTSDNVVLYARRNTGTQESLAERSDTQVFKITPVKRPHVGQDSECARNTPSQFTDAITAVESGSVTKRPRTSSAMRRYSDPIISSTDSLDESLEVLTRQSLPTARVTAHDFDSESETNETNDSSTHITLSEDHQHIVAAFGNEFAIKYAAVVETKPWEMWSQCFFSFLPSNTPGRVGFNVRLLQFFVKHGRTMWELNFYTQAKSTLSEHIAKACADLGQLVYALHKLEGITVFAFLESYPHPYWPTIFFDIFPLETLSPMRRVAYLEHHHARRWPCATPGSSFDAFKPSVFLEWAAERSRHQVLEKYRWTFLKKKMWWFKDLVHDLHQVLQVPFDYPDCSYISVKPIGGLPKEWRFMAVPPDMWDQDLKRFVSSVTV